jgi:hypothetical protein
MFTDCSIEWHLPFQICTIRRVLGVPPKTSKNTDVFEELTGMYSQRVLGGTPNIRRIPS